MGQSAGWIESRIQRLALRPSIVLAWVLALSATTAPATLANGEHPSITSPASSTITVTTTKDELNRDGDCSLREAVQATNLAVRVDRCPAGSGRDRIIVPAGTFVLTKVGERESENRTGDLDIRRSVTIEGQGIGVTVLDGFASDRLLDVFAPAAVTVEGVTLRNGAPGAGRRGGAVVVLDGASLLLRDVLVSDNATRDGPDQIPDGGGIYNDGFLKIVRGAIRDNVAGGLEGSGGGIWNSGRLTLIDTTVSGNRSDGRDPRTHAIDGGGGIYNGGVLVMRRSTVRDNLSAYLGGGVANRRTMTATDSTVEDNAAASGGGGISNVGGAVTLDGTTVTGNTAGEPGGGIRNVQRGTITVDQATSVTGNTPDDCFGTTAC